MSLKRSKAVGEPPLLLGISAWTAVKNALSYVNGGNAASNLALPATSNPATESRLTRTAQAASAAAQLQ